MARHYIPSKRQAQMPKFELTPLIDVIFILVIFFAVTTSFIQERKGLKLMLPSAVSVEQPDKATTISIDRYQRVYWNGTRIQESMIASKVQSIVKLFPDHNVIVQADKNTPYIRVISVLDAIRKSGCFNILLEAEQKS